MGLIWEHRIVLPMRVEEYQVGQLYSVAEASKNETGGGEGIEVLVNEPFDISDEAKKAGREMYPPEYPLVACGQVFKTGQYTKKIYHLASKVPSWIRFLAPKGSLRIYEEAWNAYPYCRTVITNPEYMKENFFIIIETMHCPDRGTQDNVHGLSPEELKERRVEMIDIAIDPENRADYKPEWDPKRIKTADGRGPLIGDWQASVDPVMCCYKLVRCRFKWWGLQKRVEVFIQKQERRLFHNFHRQVYCWLDKWIAYDMKSIRDYEEKTKRELDEAREKGAVRGTTADEDEK